MTAASRFVLTLLVSTAAALGLELLGFPTWAAIALVVFVAITGGYLGGNR